MFEIDSRMPEAHKFFTTTDPGISITKNDSEEDIVNLLPCGWKDLLEPIFILTRNIDNLHIGVVACVAGLLRVFPTGGEKECDVFNRISESVARDSSIHCMVCGNRGVRRKQKPYSPPLCYEHFVQYFNWLDKHGC